MDIKKMNLINVPSHALQSEGSETIVDTLLKHGLDGVVIFPAYYTEVNKNGRWRTPPLLSTFEKPVFGHESIQIERRSPFAHDKRYYNNTRVTPVQHKGNDDIWMPFIKHCKSRNLNVILAMVPLVAFDNVDEFVPRYFDGKPFEEYLGFLCPNHPDVMPFAIDSVKELTDRYGALCDGLLLDHIEYPAYSMKEIFTCFCQHCQDKAQKEGIDVDKAINEIEILFHKFDKVISEEQFDNLSTGVTDGINIGLSCPNLSRYLNFKIDTISNVHRILVSEIRKITGDKPLGNGAFAPTYSLFTGVNYAHIQKYYDFLCPKFYPQHWTKMLKNTIKEAEKNNENIIQENIINAFMKFVGIPNRSYIDDKLNVSSELVGKEALKSQALISERFIPWIHCEGDIHELEVKLKILFEHQISSAFFHEYMFLGKQKLGLIKNHIEMEE